MTKRKGGRTVTQDSHTIYILFSRSTTIPSRVIHAFAGGEYTHVSLGLEGPNGPFYTFARKYPQWPLPGGLIQEVPGRGFFGLHPDTRCCLFTLRVGERVYRLLLEKLEGMYRQRERYHYNLLGTVTAYFHLPLRRQWHYFCSEFVAEVLTESGALPLGKDASLARPMDLYALMAPEELVMKGVVGDLEA